jgi:hypothetical protein
MIIYVNDMEQYIGFVLVFFVLVASAIYVRQIQQVKEQGRFERWRQYILWFLALETSFSVPVFWFQVVFGVFLVYVLVLFLRQSLDDFIGLAAAKWYMWILVAPHI